MTTDKSNLLKKSLTYFGLTPDDRQLSMFEQYYNMLAEKNKVMNLTAITAWEDVVIRHFADSVSLVKIHDPLKISSMIDLGSGAGFPGIPLKIMFPDLKITLVDALAKRIHFLDEVIHELRLDYIETVHGRGEDLARQPAYREKYDLCVSRAVARLSVLSEYALPFVRTGGAFIAYKSEKAFDEIKESRRAVEVLGGKKIENEDICAFSLPVGTLDGSTNSRVLVRIKKIKATPLKYPRKAGIPSRKPL